MTATMHPTATTGSLLISSGAATVPAAVALRAVRVLVLAVAPVATVWAVTTQTALGDDMLAIGMWVALAFWTPLFPVSFPALLLQDARDDALVTTPAPLRWLVLVPWLALAPRSAVRVEMWANVLGVAVAAWWLLSHLPG
jgi:hypothetical protein